MFKGKVQRQRRALRQAKRFEKDLFLQAPIPFGEEIYSEDEGEGEEQMLESFLTEASLRVG